MNVLKKTTTGILICLLFYLAALFLQPPEKR